FSAEALGLHEGATENAAACSALLANLVERGVRTKGVMRRLVPSRQRGCWRRRLRSDRAGHSPERGETAGARKTYAAPPRQRPTLQKRNVRKHLLGHMCSSDSGSSRIGTPYYRIPTGPMRSCVCLAGRAEREILRIGSRRASPCR